MHHQRQAAVFLLHRLRARQRRNAVFAHHAAAHPRLQADDKVRIAVDRLLHRLRVDIRHIGQFILGNQPDAGDVKQGINLGRGFAGQLVEIIHVVRAGAARVNHGGHAGSNPHAVRLIMVYRRARITVNVGVNPARADVTAAVQRNSFARRGANLAKRRDFTVPDGDIGQGIVDEARTAQE